VFAPFVVLFVCLSVHIEIILTHYAASPTRYHNNVIDVIVSPTDCYIVIWAVGY